MDRYHEFCVEGCSGVEEATVRGGVWRAMGIVLRDVMG